MTSIAATIQEVYLGGNMLNNQYSAQIGTRLLTTRPQKLAHLDLWFNNINLEGTYGLYQVLEINPTANCPSLEGNLLGDEGATIMANLL